MTSQLGSLALGSIGSEMIKKDKIRDCQNLRSKCKICDMKKCDKVKKSGTTLGSLAPKKRLSLQNRNSWQYDGNQE